MALNKNQRRKQKEAQRRAEDRAMAARQRAAERQESSADESEEEWVPQRPIHFRSTYLVLGSVETPPGIFFSIHSIILLFLWLFHAFGYFFIKLYPRWLPDRPAHIFFIYNRVLEIPEWVTVGHVVFHAAMALAADVRVQQLGLVLTGMQSVVAAFFIAQCFDRIVNNDYELFSPLLPYQMAIVIVYLITVIAVQIMVFPQYIAELEWYSDEVQEKEDRKREEEERKRNQRRGSRS
ncbi:unnamed protein product [Caenorhabditis sp. 36 PRJEB53466]|nr:unnamed protein product [Caenorhabditis sp. 36 PRJEB53466]